MDEADFEKAVLPDIPDEFAGLTYVQELAQKIVDLNRMKQEFRELIEPIAAAAKQQEKEMEDMRKEFERALQEKGKKVREVQYQAEEIKRNAQVSAFEQDNLSRELREELDRLMREQGRLDADEKFDAFLAENGWLWGDKARDYQKRGIQFMTGAVNYADPSESLHGVANFDQMGLGKTLQATATLDILTQQHAVMCDGQGEDPDCPPWHRSVLWLCPASIKDTSMKEIKSWSPSRPVGMLQGPPQLRSEMTKLAFENGMTLVCNYETLRNTPDVIWDNYSVDSRGNPVGKNGGKPVPRQWPIIVLDEAHRFKNDGTQLFKYVEKLCENAGVIYPMTGTPIMNRPQEFWAILHMLTLQGKHKYMFEDKRRFEMEYCNTYGYETTFQYGAADRLMNRVKSMCIRRTKDEVLSQLPPKQGGITRYKDAPDELIHYVKLEGEQRRLYDMMRDRFFIWLDEQKTDALTAPVVIAQFTRLRQLALYPKGVKISKEAIEEGGDEIVQMVDCEESAKFDRLLELIDELGVAEGEKLLIFTSYEAEVIDALKARILDQVPGIEIGRITGKENSAAKAVVQERFTNPEDNMRIVIGTTRAAGIGLNLQGACSRMVFLDFDWNPGVIEQAEDRLHRIGQTESVEIHAIQAEETIDAYIMHKLLKKMNMISGVVDRQELRQALDDGLI